jgi:Fic family protein
VESPALNGNGRTARLWANSIALRYGLPPFVRLRPRPDNGYGEAGVKAMRGDWKPTAIAFRRLLNKFLNEN